MLVLVGLVFAVTACGFAMMMVRDMNPIAELEADSGGDFMQLFQQYGFLALMVELAVLALATFGAIATDEMWTDRTTSPAAVPGEKVSAPDAGMVPQSPPRDD